MSLLATGWPGATVLVVLIVTLGVAVVVFLRGER